MQGLKFNGPKINAASLLGRFRAVQDITAPAAGSFATVRPSDDQAAARSKGCTAKSLARVTDRAVMACPRKRKNVWQGHSATPSI
jgi:hypothetical protein